MKGGVMRFWLGGSSHGDEESKAELPLTGDRLVYHDILDNS